MSPDIAELVALLSGTYHNIGAQTEARGLRAALVRAENLQRNYQIGIVTALSHEAAAVQLVFDGGMPLSSQTRPAIIFHELTCPSPNPEVPHKIVMCQCIRMGNNSAAVAATALLTEFSSINDILLVGIAGGLPDMDAVRKKKKSAADHVRKGDLVVSDKIVQYDLVKMTEEGPENRCRAAPPSARLLQAAELLEQGAIAGRYPWEKFLRVHAKGDWSRPRSDVLFDYESGVANEHSLASGQEANSPVRVSHPKVQHGRRVGVPFVHRAPIGSANTLLRSYSLRDRIREQFGIRAVEMEASGIADAAWSFGVGYLAIRSICDYCDPKKDDIWHRYSALAAASYARSLIENIPSQ